MPQNPCLLLVVEKIRELDFGASITHSISYQIRLPGGVLESSWWADSETVILNQISPRFVGENKENWCLKLTDCGCMYWFNFEFQHTWYYSRKTLTYTM